MMDDWMPCYEQQPERDDQYLVTWTAKIGRDSSVRFIYICEYSDGEWVTDEIAKMGYRDIEVVAWMELPEKWEG